MTATRAPENRDELVRQLEVVNKRQGNRILELGEENKRLRQRVATLKLAIAGATASEDRSLRHPGLGKR